MKPPDFAYLHRDIKTGDPSKVLPNLANKMKEKMPIDETLQYFYDFLDYIIRFGSEKLQAPIRDVIDQLHKIKYS